MAPYRTLPDAVLRLFTIKPGEPLTVNEITGHLRWQSLYNFPADTTTAVRRRTVHQALRLLADSDDAHSRAIHKEDFWAAGPDPNPPRQPDAAPTLERTGAEAAPASDARPIRTEPRPRRFPDDIPAGLRPPARPANRPGKGHRPRSTYPYPLLHAASLSSFDIIMIFLGDLPGRVRGWWRTQPAVSSRGLPRGLRRAAHRLLTGSLGIAVFTGVAATGVLVMLLTLLTSL